MRVQITFCLDVGDDPVADAITYLIGRHDVTPDDRTASEWVEAVVLDTILQLENDETLRSWTLRGSSVEQMTD